MQVAHLRVPAPAGRVEVAKRKHPTWWTGVSALSLPPLQTPTPTGPNRPFAASWPHHSAGLPWSFVLALLAPCAVSPVRCRASNTLATQ